MQQFQYNIIALWKQVVYQFWHDDIRSSEFFVSISGLIWAVMLFWPGDTFDRPTYSIMASFAIEEIWAALFAICSIYMWAISLSVCKIRFWYDIAFKTFGCVLWSASCLAMMFSVYPPPAAIGPHIAISIATWWILVRTNYTDTSWT